LARIELAWRTLWLRIRPVLVMPQGPNARRVAAVWLALAGLVYVLGLPTDTRAYLLVIGPQETGWLMLLTGIAAYITAVYGRQRTVGRGVAILACLVLFEICYNLVGHAWVGVASYSWMCAVFIAEATTRRPDGC